jgi:glucosyl-dolichyl phosphate glucuronosyltransferase
MSDLSLSVVIATYNRAQLLEETLRSLLGADFSDIKHEVIVVDNNSTDGTSDLVALFAKQHATLRGIREPNQGLSHARNAGIAAATGEVIAFLDDDVEVDSSWPKAILESFRVSGVTCVTGKVLAYGEAAPPAWLPPRLHFLVSLADLGDAVRPLHGREKPLGCNMAFRRTVFETVGGFDTSLGRSAHTLLGGEEVMLFYRMKAAGGVALYSPKALVHHKIAPKTQVQYVFEHAFWLGVSESYIERHLMPLRWIAKSARALSRMAVAPMQTIWRSKFTEINGHNVYREFITRYERGYVARHSTVQAMRSAGGGAA